MVQKRVPDWLNSPIWSSTPPPPTPYDDDHLLDSSPSTSKSTTTSTTAAVRTEPPKVEIRDPVSNDSDDESPSAEDISRLAQLELELSRKVVNMGELRRVASQGFPSGAGIRSAVWKQLDNSVVGIRSTISKPSRLLKEYDEELLRHLEVTTNVNPQFYSFRLITLLLTQEFDFADILVIWDALLSDPEGPQETLLRICCAMLILIWRRLLAGDFTSNLKLLQHYPSTNIRHLLYVGNKLRKQQPL